MRRLPIVILLCGCGAGSGDSDSGSGETEDGASSSSASAGSASGSGMTGVDSSATSPSSTSASSSSDGSSSEGDDAPSESGSGSETGDDTGGPSIPCGDAMHGAMAPPETVQWTNVSPVPKGNGLVADPAISGDFYVFYQVAADNSEESRVQKTTDFGETWTDVDGSALNGNAWGVAIDPNRDRCVGQDPCPAPTLYRPAGYGFNNPDGTALGMWKSTDGGATWNNLFRDYWDGEVPTPDGGTAMIPPDSNGITNDFYAAHILPDDPPNHVLVTYHYGSGQLLETKDGGDTWDVHSVPWGTSHYAFGFDASTWIVIPQQFDAPGAMYRTTTAGRVDGEISVDAWTQVDTSLHCHGAFTPWIDPTDCSVVIGGSEGTKRTFDQGATWELVDPNGACTVSGSPDLWFISGLFSTSARRIDVREEPVAVTPYDFEGDWQGIPPYGTATAWDEANAQWVILATQYGGGVWRMTVAG